MNRTRLALVIAPLAVAGVAAFFGVKIHAELAQGQPVFWLAELWPPAAVLTIITVVSIDLVAPPAEAKPK